MEGYTSYWNSAEKKGYSGTAIFTKKKPIAVTYGIGKEERTEYIAAYCQTLRECGYTPIIHADEAFLSDCIDMEKLGSCRLWLTQYDSKLTYTMPCEIWQYTAKGMVDGISGYTGLNIGYGK